MPNPTTSLPESIVELQAKLDGFRSTHQPRTRLPATLWQSAAALARCHGLYVVARSLNLDYSTLKKHLSGSGEGGGTRKKSQPKFIELIGAARQSVDEYVIEFESARGCRLRIHCKTNMPPDWPVLLRAWRGE